MFSQIIMKNNKQKIKRVGENCKKLVSTFTWSEIFFFNFNIVDSLIISSTSIRKVRQS